MPDHLHNQTKLFLASKTKRASVNNYTEILSEKPNNGKLASEPL